MSNKINYSCTPCTHVECGGLVESVQMMWWNQLQLVLEVDRERSIPIMMVEINNE